MQFRLSQVADATGGTVVGDDVRVDGASIDSRTIPDGALFVPVVAERDGHDFIAAAIDAGANAFIADRQIDTAGPYVKVDDTAAALEALAAVARNCLPELIIGVTGSVGKTSTKDLVSAAMSAHMRTHASYRSFNNELGVPLTLINAPDDVEAVVVEMGARGTGHIRALCDFVRPTIGVVTKVGAAHTELFGSIEAVAEGKAELIEALPPNGTAVLNADDHRVGAMASRTEANVITFGLKTGDVRAASVTLDDELRPHFVAETPWGSAEFDLTVAGLTNVENALAAVAVAGSAGVALNVAAAGLSKAQIAPWRMAVSRTSTGALLINDAYNANPMSVAAALRSLAAVPATRRVAVLGTMAELGTEHGPSHHAMGELANELNIEVLSYQETAYNAANHTTHDELIEQLVELSANDAILVKGSRIAGLEQLAARL